MKSYEFKKSRRKKQVNPLMSKKDKGVQVKVKEEMQAIQGKMPGSMEEYYFALALMRKEYDFSFQVSYSSIGL
jgi:hypothetical protein